MHLFHSVVLGWPWESVDQYLVAMKSHRERRQRVYPLGAAWRETTAEGIAFEMT